MAPQPAAQAFYRESGTRERVRGTIRDYLGFFDAKRGGDVDTRRAGYAEMINQYYDLVTDFYEYGWGHSFHFAPRDKGESFKASLARHEHYLALRLGLGEDHRVLDIGCGVGGPMREIARFSGARVEGINNNAYQLGKLARYNAEAGLEAQCSGTKGDFMAMPFEDASFDAAYAIEATCHAPDKAACFAEVARVLSPGAMFAGYEWCITDRYDASNARHREIKHGIEVGDGLPDLATTGEVDDALVEAGFEVVEARDLAPTSDPETPWELPLKGEGLGSLTRSTLGRLLTHTAVTAMEAVRIAPKGSREVSAMLNAAADALVAGGETGIFTPCYFFLARKVG